MNTQYNSSYIFSITLVATLGGLLFGYDTAVISGTVESLNTVFVAPQNLSESAANSLLGFCVASALIGCIIGGALGGYCSNRFGRRDSLKIAAVLFFISGVGSAWPELGFTSINPDNTVPVYLAGYVPEFVIYRIIGGIGVGLASMLSPMYIAELAPAHIRGKLVSFNQFAIIFGQLLVYCVNYFIARSGDASWLNTDGWRYMFASECIPALLFLMLLYTVPESPRWLMSRGKQEQAESILRKIMGNTLATQAVQEIKHSLDHGRKTGGRLLMFGVGVIVIGVMLSIFQQFVGINVVLYYAPEVFKTLGASTDIALLQTIIVGVINLTFTVLAIMTVDKFGVSHCKLSAHSEWQSVCLASVPRFTLRHRVLWRYCRCCSMLPPLPCPGVRYAGYCCRKSSRMLFVVKRWQSRWRPSGWRTTSSPGPSR